MDFFSVACYLFCAQCISRYISFDVMIRKKRSNIDIKQIKTRNLHRLELNEYFSCLWSRSMCIRVVSSGEGYLQ